MVGRLVIYCSYEQSPFRPSYTTFVLHFRATAAYGYKRAHSDLKFIISFGNCRDEITHTICIFSKLTLKFQIGSEIAKTFVLHFHATAAYSCKRVDSDLKLTISFGNCWGELTRTYVLQSPSTYFSVLKLNFGIAVEPN